MKYCQIEILVQDKGSAADFFKTVNKTAEQLKAYDIRLTEDNGINQTVIFYIQETDQ